MGSFLTPLDVRRLEGNKWMILAPFEYHLGTKDGKEFVRVSAGTITDFASIPFPISHIFHPVGRDYDKPAVIHDALYVVNFVYTADGTTREITRREADAILFEAMGVCSVDRLTKRMIHLGVRAGGWKPWNKYRTAEADRLVLAQAAGWWIGNPWDLPPTNV